MGRRRPTKSRRRRDRANEEARWPDSRWSDLRWGAKLVRNGALALLVLALLAYAWTAWDQYLELSEPPAAGQPVVPGTVHDGVDETTGSGQATHASASGSRPSIPDLAPVRVFHFLRNPLNGLDTLRVVERMPERPDDSTGWLYCPGNGDIQPNCSGVDSSGKAFYDPLPH